jgi:hypothetical protein
MSAEFQTTALGYLIRLKMLGVNTNENALALTDVAEGKFDYYFDWVAEFLDNWRIEILRLERAASGKEEEDSK